MKPTSFQTMNIRMLSFTPDGSPLYILVDSAQIDESSQLTLEIEAAEILGRKLLGQMCRTANGRVQM